MVHKCCVTGCQSNCNCKDSTEYVTVFSFPKDKDVVKEWIKRIPRENISKAPVVVTLTMTVHWQQCHYLT